MAIDPLKNIKPNRALQYKKESIEKEFEIDLATYSAGIYFINITYENNIIQNFKIIKK